MKIQKMIARTLVLSIVLLIYFSSVYAENVCSINAKVVELGGRDVKITGTSDVAEGEKLTIIVTKPEYEYQDFSQGEIMEYASYFAQCPVKADKSFELIFSMPVNDTYGEYNVFAGGFSNARVLDTTFAYVSNQDIDYAIGAINNCSTADELYSKLETDTKLISILDLLDVDMNSYAGMEPDDRKNVANVLWQNGTDYAGDNRVLDVKKNFNISLVLIICNDDIDVTEFESLILSHSEDLQIDIDGAYKKLSNEQKHSIFASMYDMRPFTDVVTIKNKYFGELVVTYLNAITHYNFNDFLTYFADELELDMEKYNGLSSSQKNAVAKSVKTNTYNNPDEIISAFNAAISNPGTASGGNHVSGGGGGVGGGGSSSNRSYSTKADLGYINSTISNEPVQSTDSFNDLQSVAWAVRSINELYAKGVISGDGNGRFRPNDNITREEFVKMLVLSIGLENEASNSSFKDVDSDKWYYTYISSAVECGIVNGIDSENFGITQKVTRQDMASMVYRAAQYKGYKFDDDSNEITFDDADKIAEYAENAISALSKKQIINGVGDGLFAPLEFSTRAQAAKILYEVCKLLSI